MPESIWNHSSIISLLVVPVAITSALYLIACRSNQAAVVISVSRDNGEHHFTKKSCSEITLLVGLGVEGDSHCGATVQHRSRIAAANSAKVPHPPNLRQVHLLGQEQLQFAGQCGHVVPPGGIGENILTSGVDLHELPVGTTLRIGSTLLAITGERNPCPQIEAYQKGLLQCVLFKEQDEQLRRAGVMAVVLEGGTVQPGCSILVQRPPPPYSKLKRV